MKHHATNLILGMSGAGAVELVQAVPPPSSAEFHEIIKTLVQVVIGIATLFGLFKKNKSIPSTNSKP